MASPFSKIKRAISYLRSFLDYNREEYQDAARNIRAGEGWNLPVYAEGLYRLAEGLEGSLYEDLYPKLTEEEIASDDEILDLITNLITALEREDPFFADIAKVKSESALPSIAGIVHSLVKKALYQLRETLQLAAEDREAAAKEAAAPQAVPAPEFRIGIVTATIEELEAVRQLMEEVVTLPRVNDDAHTYYSGYFKNEQKAIPVILTRCMHQGTSAAAVLTTKLIMIYQPALVVMLGHAAGNRNMASEVKVGDILVAEMAVDYDQVSIVTKKDANGEPYTVEKDRKHSISADGTLTDKILQFATQTTVLADIKAGYRQADLFKTPLNLKAGKVISGDALVRSDTWFEQITGENAGTIGLDMETYGFYYAAQNTVFRKKPLFVSLKSVSDFGSERHRYEPEIKPHPVRIGYATYTSAGFFQRFALAHLPLE